MQPSPSLGIGARLETGLARVRKEQMKFWNLIFLLGLLAYVLIRGIFEQRVKDTATALSRGDGRERALLLLMFIGGCC